MTRSILLAALVNCNACTVDADVGEQVDRVVAKPQPLLVCQQGLGDRTMGDKGLFALCEALEQEGHELVRDGDLAAFGALSAAAAYDALFDALDTNADGWANDHDEPKSIRLIGFSWGGVGIVGLAHELLADPRVAWSRLHVDTLALLDPYRPYHGPIALPHNVRRAWIYRQSQADAGDCSNYLTFGYGFHGLMAKATESTQCADYDLDVVLPGTGHCSLISRAHDAVFANISAGLDHEAWMSARSDCLVGD
jgi:hypothetical protein